jgi:flagella basal body P-ring formation protein FlgA
VILAALVLSCCLNAPLGVTVNADTISVGAILPLPSADPRAAVGLGYAPNPGLARRIARHEILSKIQAAGLTVDDLQLPESFLVKRQAGVLDPELVRQAVLTAFVRQFPGANIEIVSVDTPASQISTEPVSMTATLPPRFDPNQSVFVRLEVRGRAFAKTVFVRSMVRIESVQPVLRNRVAANSEVRAEDVEWKPAPIAGAAKVPGSVDELRGMLAKRDLEAGQVLNAELFFTPLYVRKGESVTVKATAGGVTVAATMKAMAAGRLGETIAVQHLTGSGSTTARVVGPRTLEAIQR